MPAFRVEVFKSYQGEKWENVYLLQGTSIELAATAGAEIAEMERRFHLDQVMFDYVRVSSTIEGDDLYVTIPIGQPGLRGAQSDMYPLFATLRVDILVVGSGRPSRKYYRGVLEESEVQGGFISGSLRSSVSAVIDEVIAGSEAFPQLPLVDPDDQPWDSAVVYPKPQMRQLTRGRRRRPAASELIEPA